MNRWPQLILTRRGVATADLSIYAYPRPATVSAAAAATVINLPHTRLTLHFQAHRLINPRQELACGDSPHDRSRWPGNEPDRRISGSDLDRADPARRSVRPDP
jgi:hypothetical protein